MPAESHEGLKTTAKNQAADIAKAFGGGSTDKFKQLLDFHVETSKAQEKNDATTVNVPVWLTVLVKQLEDDPDHEGQVQLSGTIIQRTLFFDASRMTTPSAPEGGLNGFQIRLNDERQATEDQVVERKNITSDIKKDGKPTGLMARAVTSSCVLPMKMKTIYDAQPFFIGACEVRSARESSSGPSGMMFGPLSPRALLARCCSSSRRLPPR